MLHYIHKLEKGRLEKIVGLFVVFGGGLLISAFLIIGGQQNFFGTYELRTIMDYGHGLKAGTPVNLIGMEVGRINAIRLNEKNKVEIIMNIKKKYQNKIKMDSTAKVINLDLLGNAVMEISMGSSSEPSAENGTIIKSANSGQHGEGFGSDLPAMVKANLVMDNAIELLKSFSAPIKRMDHIIERFDAISEEIREGKGSIGAFLNDDKLYLKLTEIADNSQKIMATLEDTTTHLQNASRMFPEMIKDGEDTMNEIRVSAEILPELLIGLKELTVSINGSADKLNAVIHEGGDQVLKITDILENFQEASESLPHLVESAEENIDEFSRIVEGAERNWIVKGFIQRKKTEEPILLNARDHHYRENK